MSKLVKSKFEIAFNIRQEASPPKIETDFITRTGALIIYQIFHLQEMRPYPLRHCDTV